MGNLFQKTEAQGNSVKSHCNKERMDLVNIKFLESFENVSTSGLYFNEIYLPEEVVENILSYVPENKILKLTLVCKRWCNIIKSENLWMCKYNRTHHDKAKKLPWYVFYSYFTTDNFKNLLKNGNGEKLYNYWTIVKNSGDMFKIEDPPVGAEPLPHDVLDFNGQTSCFVTSFNECSKVQEISLKNKGLLRYILRKHMPHLYVSEWTAGRFDCACTYKLGIRGLGNEVKSNTHLECDLSHNTPGNSVTSLFEENKQVIIEQWQGSEWEKVEIIITQYNKNLDTLFFEHEGRDLQFWKGHYGSKMAGGVVKFLFNSIQPLKENDIVSSNLLEDL